MPFRSASQRRWMFANEPEMARRWAAHTPKGAKLPERVKRAMTEIPSLEHFYAQDPTRGGMPRADIALRTHHDESKKRWPSLREMWRTLRGMSPEQRRAFVKKTLTETAFPGAGVSGSPTLKTSRMNLAAELKKLRATPEGRAHAMVGRSGKFLGRRWFGALVGTAAGAVVPVFGWPVSAAAGSKAAQKISLPKARRIIASRRWGSKHAAMIYGFFDELLKIAQEEDEDLSESGIYAQILSVMKRLGSSADPNAVARFKRLARTIPAESSTEAPR